MHLHSKFKRSKAVMPRENICFCPKNSIVYDRNTTAIKMLIELYCGIHVTRYL